MFPRVKKGGWDLKARGQAMAARKQELLVRIPVLLRMKSGNVIAASAAHERCCWSVDLSDLWIANLADLVFVAQ